MRSIGAYTFHVTIAALAVFLPAMAEAVLTASLLRALGFAIKPTQFAADHLLFFCAFTGVCLSYEVCDVLTSRAARWVWIPFAVIFLVRVVSWNLDEGTFSAVRFLSISSPPTAKWRLGAIQISQRAALKGSI